MSCSLSLFQRGGLNGKGGAETWMSGEGTGVLTPERAGVEAPEGAGVEVPDRTEVDRGWLEK